jgi:hypothetical protein
MYVTRLTVVVVVVVLLLYTTEATLAGDQGFLFEWKRGPVVECFVGSRLGFGGAARIRKDGKVDVYTVGGTRKSSVVRSVHVDTAVAVCIVLVVVVVVIVVVVVVLVVSV